MSSSLVITAKKKDISIDIIDLSTTPTRWLREEIDNLPYGEERVVSIGEVRDWISTLDRMQYVYAKRVIALKQELADERELLTKATTSTATENIRRRIDDIKSSIVYYSDVDSNDAAFGDPWCCDRCLSALKVALSVMEENAFDKDVEFYIFAD